jgi:hypothetical protein
MDVPIDGAGLRLTPSGTTACLVEEQGALAAEGGMVIDVDAVFGLLHRGRA